MAGMKNHEWCAAYPHAAADEIKRLETELRSANEDKALLNRELSVLQNAMRECAETANSVAATLKCVQQMLKEKGL
jgi:hypothetical protein